MSSSVFPNKRHCGGCSISRRTQKYVDDEPPTVISSKLNELSLEERLKVEYELHGVADAEEETPELLRKRVEEMDQALSDRVHFSRDDTSAYETALKMSKAYVKDLKVIFLRAEAYNGKEAADRMIRFFDRKRYLFGEEKLTKDIHLSDCDGEEIDALKQGVLMVLPQCDRAGRAVVVLNGAVNVMYSTKQIMRLILYVMMVAVQDTEGAQKRGIVIIYHGFGQTFAVRGRAMEFWKNWRSLPIRIVACHYCGDNDNVIGPPVRQFCAVAERITVCRFRCHYGPLIECMYKLMTFGIPVNEAMPITVDGRIDLTLHHNMMKEWQMREEKQKQRVVAPANTWRPALPVEENEELDTPLPGTYVIPGNLDIVMGRGRHPKSSPGSIQLHKILRQHREAYDMATRCDKAIIAKAVLCKLKRIGCRFIKASPEGHQVCEDSMAREKISHGFRNLRLKDTSEGHITSSSCTGERPVKRPFNMPAAG